MTEPIKDRTSARASCVWLALTLWLLVLAVGIDAYAVSRCGDTIHRCPRCEAIVWVAEPSHSDECRVEGPLPFAPLPAGREYWSDGRWEGMLPEACAALFRCPGCGQLVWKADAKQLANPDVEPVRDEWLRAPRVGCGNTTIDWLAALAGADAEPPSRQRYLRLNAWWACNASNCLQGADTALANGHRDNLESLLRLLSPTEPGDRLLRAEALREVGRFEAASQELATPVSPPYEGVRAFLQHRVDAREVGPAKIPKPCQTTNPDAPGKACFELLTGDPNGTARRDNSALLNLIDSLLNSPQVSLASVCELTNVELRRETNTGVVRVYQSAAHPNPLLGGLTVRESARAVVVEMTIAPDRTLSGKDVEDRFGKQRDIEPFPRHHPPFMAMTWVYTRGGRTVSFRVDRQNDRVEEVSISAPVAATRATPQSRAVFALIDALLAQPRLTVEAVARLSGRRLDRVADIDVPRVFRTDTQPDLAVRLIEAREAPKLAEAFVIVELGSAGFMPVGEATDHFGGPDDRRPEPATRTQVLTYRKGARTLSVIAGARDELVQSFVLSSDD